MNERERRLLAEELACFRELDAIVGESDGPPLMKKFIGRKPSKTLAGDGWEVWHQAVVYALAGQRLPLNVVLRSHAFFVAAKYPVRTAYMEETAQILRWCASRTGLLGWSEVWDVPVTVHGSASSMSRPLIHSGDSRYVWPETDAVFRRDYGDLSGKSGWRSVPKGEVSGLQQLVMALERSVLALSVPSLNNAGLSEERLLELVDFYARMIRMWMGLPQEQPVPEPNFGVDLPPEFQGFGPHAVV